MDKVKKPKTIIRLVAIFLITVVLVLWVRWLIVMDQAHNTFDGYYSFSGCIKLLEKTPTFGRCNLKDDKTIMIVKHQNKWYLSTEVPK